MQYPLDINLQYCYRNNMSREIRGDPRGFIARVDAAIARQGLQVYEFSEMIGQAGSYWSQWKSRHRERETFPRGDTLMAMKSVLDVPLTYLLGLPAEEGDDVLLSVAEPRAPYLSDAALMLKFGGEVVPPEEAEPALEEFTATALHGRGNLIPQNYDDMRGKPRPKGKRQPKPEPTTFRLRVSGNCLAPRFVDEPHTIGDGEIAWFDTRLEREPICLVFAVKDDHEGHIKRLVNRDGAPWLESNDGWAAPVDDHWRVVARAFTAQRRLW